MNYTSSAMRNVVFSAATFLVVMLLSQNADAQCVTRELKDQWRAGGYQQVVLPLVDCHNARPLGVTALEYEYMLAKTLCNLPRQKANGCKAYSILKSERSRYITVFGSRIDLDQDACCALPEYRAAASSEQGVGVSQQFIKVPFGELVRDVRNELANEDSSVRRMTATAVERYAQITSKHSGRCMDIMYGSGENAALLIQFDCNNQANQSLRLVKREDGFYNIIVRHSGKCLDVNGASQDNGAEIIQHDCHNGDNQRFRIARGVDGYSIIAKHSGKCLDVYGWNQENMAHIVQWDCHFGANQMWAVDSESLGTGVTVGPPTGRRGVTPRSQMRVDPPPPGRRPDPWR